MNGFYISVSNGLLTPEHRDRIGAAIWEFLWCLDKITKIDDKGSGYVLGGKPIFLADLAGQMGTSEDTASRNLHRLEEAGYIKIIRTPHGLSIRVFKAKKRFYKNAVSQEKSETAEMQDGSAEMRYRPRKNAVCNKTVSVDSNSIDSNIAPQSAAPKDIVEIIDLFKVVNPAYSKWYANKTQRDAIKRLLATHGKDQLAKVLEFLPKSNTIPYVPTATTPLQLEDKWAGIKAALQKIKSNQPVLL